MWQQPALADILPSFDKSLRATAIMNDPQNTLVSQPITSDAAPVKAAPTETPQHIARYRIERVLGKGGFGTVYLAYDDQLQRMVAIKVPHSNLISHPENAKAYLTEARTVANLDHPHIVPVFDFGSSVQFPCYLVSKYIDGTDLATALKQSRLSIHETVELVATVAEALHHAHKQGLVHRDIKPGNILLDKSGKPFVADFGLALREQDMGKGATFAGTPAYMSPEQARGEGHRVDGRSDIFSLGVVMYELLVGHRPFRADTQAELMQQVTDFEARPPRQYDDNIPKELDRICLKALSKRVSERYSASKDMADDLRHFLTDQTLNLQSGASAKGIGSASFAPVPQPSFSSTASSLSVAASVTATALIPDSRPIKILPKGLRSFDAHDADFFLELVPGPRDRDGLPDSIRFWHTRIEETDADSTFSVGLIYGPSGCGKSSLVKAGLLPRLSDDVLAVYVEATAAETETRLLNGLRKQCIALSDKLSLTETLAALRRGQGIPPGKKALIVLDQFEQWLHAKKDEQNTELVQALRQCDGGRVQCIVMVRDDFWLAVSRFLRDLEIRLIEGENSALADLFDEDHALKVLAAFGRAFGKLPETNGKTNENQKEFLKQAVKGLAQEGKVICVRLALFAEMMKGKPWTPATLKEVGGTEGVGVTFLEETFSAATAPPEHRYHQKAARGVLKALLPVSGTDIKGLMRSYGELLETSGYASRPKDFDDLIHILDSEIRLITPTDPEGKEEGPASSLKTGEKYYQLTHDYLVPSLRDWLTRKQKETRRGRAELLLADRAAVWNLRKENRQLPSMRQWLSVHWLTTKNSWTPLQRKMMRRANRYHTLQGIALGLILAVLTITGLAIQDQIEEQKRAHQAAERTIREQSEEQRKATHATGLVQRVLDAETAQVPGIIGEISEYRRWADPLLREEYGKAAVNSRQKLHASLALLPVDSGQVNYLYGRLLIATPQAMPVIRDALAPHKDELLEKLWRVAEKPEQGKFSQLLRAASALAKYDPEGERWGKTGALVVNDLVQQNPIFLGQWSEAFRPVKNRLLPQLSEIFRDRHPEHTAERNLATSILEDYAADQPDVLADLLMDADEKEFAVIYPKLKDRGEEGLALLLGEVAKKMPPEASDDLKEKLAKRQANAASALLKMNRVEKVWPLLRHSPDPRARSYLIHRLRQLGVEVGALIKHLAEEPDVSIRRALLLSLGEYSDKELSPDERELLLPKLQEIHRTAADPGLHASAEWLLRQWKEEMWLKQVNLKWAKEWEDKGQREKRLDGIKQLLANEKEKALPQWYVNSQGQTMVVIPGPVEFQMGSPPSEAAREPEEVLHWRRINRTFAIAAKSVTVEQYRRFERNYNFNKQYAPEPDCPAIDTSWHQAAAYCNWLSQKEGLDPCYEEDGNGNVTGLKEDYLSLNGYRLPMEAEFEYACRAGTVTSRYYGSADELLAKYAWYIQVSSNRNWPGGSLKPNDFGLFDMHGNVWSWCQERHSEYPKRQGVVVDKEDILPFDKEQRRVLRGGSYVDPPPYVRSANRMSYVPTSRIDNIGFRVARTLTP
jgi:eukaryotic-like serine/threonine-protein kinase